MLELLPKLLISDPLVESPSCELLLGPQNPRTAARIVRIAVRVTNCCLEGKLFGLRKETQMAKMPALPPGTRKKGGSGRETERESHEFDKMGQQEPRGHVRQTRRVEHKEASF